jgi:hypothetical protein
MKNIKLSFDDNGVAEIPDEYENLASELSKHPYNLTYMKEYDPKAEQRKIYKNQLHSLKKEEIVGIAEQNGISTKGENDKELTKAKLIESILVKLI